MTNTKEIYDALNTRNFNLASPDDLLFLAEQMMKLCKEIEAINRVVYESNQDYVGP